MTPTPDQLTDQLAAELHTAVREASWATGIATLDSDTAALRDRIAAVLTPFVAGLLADARTEGFRHGYTAGRTLTRQHMS